MSEYRPYRRVGSRSLVRQTQANNVRMVAEIVMSSDSESDGENALPPPRQIARAVVKPNAAEIESDGRVNTLEDIASAAITFVHRNAPAGVDGGAVSRKRNSPAIPRM